MIRIQNIYHMLAYAFYSLKENGYEKYAVEDFENTAELLAAILTRGISKQIKRGLGRSYIEDTEALSCLRGKINISESIKQQTILKRQLICTYENFSVDTKMNRILKSTIELLLKNAISKARKKDLRKLLVFFQDVSTIDLFHIDWNFKFNRNNQSYQMLMSICYLVIKGLIHKDESGNVKLMSFLDEQRMCRLYEKFILEYYKRHYKQIKTSTSYIRWSLDDDMDYMLPIMKTDIVLSYKNKVLIIDAKYYSQTTQKRFESNTLHSNNLYQIFAYVKNHAMNTNKEVSGLLLYAKTDDSKALDHTYKMSGNDIGVKTLDLNCDFKKISSCLDSIANKLIAQY